MSWRCRIGLHAWRTAARTASSLRQECTRCAKRRLLARLFGPIRWADIEGDYDWKRGL